MYVLLKFNQIIIIIAKYVKKILILFILIYCIFTVLQLHFKFCKKIINKLQTIDLSNFNIFPPQGISKAITLDCLVLSVVLYVTPTEHIVFVALLPFVPNGCRCQRQLHRHCAANSPTGSRPTGNAATPQQNTSNNNNNSSKQTTAVTSCCCCCSARFLWISLFQLFPFILFAILNFFSGTPSPCSPSAMRECDATSAFHLLLLFYLLATMSDCICVSVSVFGFV